MRSQADWGKASLISHLSFDPFNFIPNGLDYKYLEVIDVLDVGLDVLVGGVDQRLVQIDKQNKTAVANQSGLVLLAQDVGLLAGEEKREGFERLNVKRELLLDD